jgi:type I restriction enzyme R subunit
MAAIRGGFTEDYLTAFARFVRENPAHIQAIRILLHRPRDWGTDALSELRQKLPATPERFNIANLQKAHEIHYHKVLVDIISMIKHAAKKGEPLLTAEQRVEGAFATAVAGRAFTPDQHQWLGLIKAHLIENLTIDREDFQTLPSCHLLHLDWKTGNGEVTARIGDHACSAQSCLHTDQQVITVG